MTSITMPVRARLACGAGYGPVRAVYEEADPYAVQLRFTLQPVTWVISRDLLMAGLNRDMRALQSPVGLGDIVIGPTTDPRQVEVVLRSPAGTATVHLNRADLESFVAETLALVPQGRESDRLDLSLALAEFFRQAPS